MESESLKLTDAQSAAVAVAPRVTLANIEEAIDRTFYLTARQAAEMTAPEGTFVPSELGTLTICMIVMKNGFTVIGTAAPASPENFNAELGRKYAYENGVRQIWPLMGFALRDKMRLAS
jgi:hypothetical protein